MSCCFRGEPLGEGVVRRCLSGSSPFIDDWGFGWEMIRRKGGGLGDGSSCGVSKDFSFALDGDVLTDESEFVGEDAIVMRGDIPCLII